MGAQVSSSSTSFASTSTKGWLAHVDRPQDVKDGLSTAVKVGAELLGVHVRLVLAERRLWKGCSKHLARVLVPDCQDLKMRLLIKNILQEIFFM